MILDLKTILKKTQNGKDPGQNYMNLKMPFFHGWNDEFGAKEVVLIPVWVLKMM